MSGVEVRVQLVRSRDSFSLMDPMGLYSLHIEEANLLFRHVKISPSVLLAHSQLPSKTTAKYPLTRVEVKAITMHSGIHGQTLENIISTAPIHKVLSQRSEQERSISTAEQKSSISPLNTRRCYLGAQCKKDLSRRSIQKGAISAFSARRFYLGVKFETIITIIKENLHPSIRGIRDPVHMQGNNADER